MFIWSPNILAKHLIKFLCSVNVGEHGEMCKISDGGRAVSVTHVRTSASALRGSVTAAQPATPPPSAHPQP